MLAFISFVRLSPLLFVAFIFLCALIFFALFAPYIAPYSPHAPDYNAILQPPSLAHLAGTDTFGRDIFSRLLYGLRFSLFIGITSTALGLLIGLGLGLWSGYRQGLWDGVFMRLCDGLLAFPNLLLVVALVSFLGRGFFPIIVSLSVFSIPVFARLARSCAITAKTHAYVENALVMGTPFFMIIIRHLLPSALPVVFSYAALRVGSAILISSSLTFLGLGLEPSTPEFGSMLSLARDYLSFHYWYLSFFPGILLLFTVLAFVVIGDFTAKGYKRLNS